MTVTVSPQCVYVCMYAHAWCAICVHEPEAFQTHNPRIHPHYTRLKQRLHSIFVTLRYFRSSNIFFLYQTKTTWVNTTAFSKFWFHLVVVKKILNLLSPMWKCNSVKVSVHNPTTWKRMRKKRHPRENSKVKTISDQKEHKASSHIWASWLLGKYSLDWWDKNWTFLV